MVCYQLVSISYLITLQGDHSVRGFKRRWWSHKCSSRTEGFVNIVIYLPTKHLGALKNSFECLRAFQIERAYAVLSVCYIRWVFSAWIDNWRREETNSRCLSWKDVHLLVSQWRREGTNSGCLSQTGVHFVESLHWRLRWKLANRVFKKMLWRWQKLWSRWRRKKRAAKARVSGERLKSGPLRMHFQHSRAKIRVFEQNTDIIKGTCSRFSACAFIKLMFFCRDMLYLVHKQFDHVIMLSKNQSAQSLDQIMWK